MAAPPDPSLETQDGRLAARTLAAGVAVMAVALLLARLMLWGLHAALPASVTEDATEGLGRLQEAMAALPGLARRDGPTALVVGSSLVQHGFSPEVFDARAREEGLALTSWNLGFPGIDSEVQRLVAERIRDAYVRSGRRADWVLLEFTPFQATTARAASERYAELARVKEAVLAGPGDLARACMKSPSDGAHLVALKSLGGQSPRAVTAALGRVLIDEGRPAWWPVPDPPDTTALRKALVARIRRERPEAAGPERPWPEKRRGEVRWVYGPDTAEAYSDWARLRASPELMESELHWRVASTDILALHFDPARLRAFIEAARTLRRVAKHELIFVAPTNPGWIHRTAEGRARLAAALERIRRETGAEVVDLSDAPGFTPADFVDTTHLSELGGRPKLSRTLAERVAAFVNPAY